MRINMTIEAKRVREDLHMPDSSILMYTTEDGLTKIEVTFEDDTVWLSIDQMAELFQRDRSVIGKHVRNIFKEGELEKKKQCGQNLQQLPQTEKLIMLLTIILM